ncbi:hypothetical protein SCHPADRAFT_548823 [Schizopora paradoxa]|uniref:Uncharacterized protein n=1 Tax=Schizopora paradoxa TaxID=27342 RepID=A0A0H2RE34_9AGAM|nr:hypothetical protein SCHPADRAFT_548823 [Schizopora paradoxa]
MYKSPSYSATKRQRFQFLNWPVEKLKKSVEMGIKEEVMDILVRGYKRAQKRHLSHYPTSRLFDLCPLPSEADMTLDDTDRSRSPSPESPTQTSVPSEGSNPPSNYRRHPYKYWQPSDFRLSLTKIGGLWTKATPKRFRSPRQIANEIRRLRGHGDSTVYERHERYSWGHTSCSNLDKLIPLCSSIITLARKTSNTEDTKVANSEISKLIAEDPLVYQIFQHCGDEIASKFSSSQVADLEILDSSDVQDGFCRWSLLLGSGSFKSHDNSQSMQANCNALKGTFLNDKCSNLAIEYLPHFLDCVVVERPDLPLWIKSLDLCFKSIIESKKSLRDFASPEQLARVATHLVEHSTDAPFVFASFFPVPKIKYDFFSKYTGTILLHTLLSDGTGIFVLHHHTR